MITNEVVTALQEAMLSLESQLESTTDLSGRLAVVVRSLRESWPEAQLYLCSLEENSDRQIVAVDARGQPALELQEQLASLGSSDTTAWQEQLARRGTPVIVSGEEVLLGVVLDGQAKASGELAALTRLGLTFLVRLVQAEAVRRRMRAILEEQEILESLANVGELSSVIAHDLTNFLNMILLQVAVLELRLPKSEHGDLVTIRRGGNQASALLNRFQEYRRPRADGLCQADLHQVLRLAADRLIKDLAEILPLQVEFSRKETTGSPGSVTVVVDRPGPNSWVRGHPVDVRRLLYFLIRNGVRAAAGAGKVVVLSVEPDSRGPTLCVQSAGPFPTPIDLNTLFDSSAPSRAGIDPFELATCRYLAHRLGCRLQAEMQPEGNLCLKAEFQSATPR